MSAKTAKAISPSAQKSAALPKPLLVLNAVTAEEMMTKNPISISASAKVREAAAFLVDRSFSGVPVIDTSGRPVGMLSLKDIAQYERERKDYLPRPKDAYQRASNALPKYGEKITDKFQIEDSPTAEVSEIMTPILFTVSPKTSAKVVIEEMLQRKIHRVVVLDEAGTLIGIITTTDVLNRLAF